MSDGLREAVQRKGSFLQTMKAVAWSFFGVRKSAGYERDASEINPVHVIIAGLIGAHRERERGTAAAGGECRDVPQERAGRIHAG